MTVANYSTKISCGRTVGEIQEMLAEHGAESVLIEFQDKQPAAVSFRILVGDRSVPFRLPINPEATLVRLEDDPAVPGRLCHLDQARKVAWRTVRQWLLAQLQFIADGQVSFVQAMMPYALDEQSGQTFFEAFSQRLLAAPEGDSL